MSTLQLKGFKNKTTLPHFKSTNSIHPRTRFSRTPNKHQHHSTLLTPYSPSLEQDSTITSKTLLETNLPDIHSKKNSQKRSTFLEMWLDEALDPQEKQGAEENPPLRVEVDKTGPLRTVQKFQIDKKYLKSQNISVELIDKIYHSLYVYTYGINHTFEQIISLTKGSQHVEKKIVDSFWKAFIRLLEGCTSFQTTFQVIEQSHIKAKVELKESFRMREEEWMREKAALEAENIKLMKKVNELSLTISKITADYNISQATLQLTDQAFNDEVNVRLMFEEKVNAIFSSYDQLRNKYNQLLSDFRDRQAEQKVTNIRQSKLKKQLQLAQIRLQQANKQLQRATKDIEARDGELSIKRQEIFELQGINQQLIEEKGQNDQQVRKIVNKLTQFKHLCQESRAESKTKGLLLSETQKRLQEQNKQLQASRNLQEKLYSQLQVNSQQIYNLKQRSIQLTLQLDQAKVERDKRLQQALRLQSVNLELQSKIANIEKDLAMAQGELIIKNSLIEKNIASIAALQAVNAKLQALLSAITAQKDSTEAQLHKAVEISERFKEEMTGMRMLLDSKGTEIEEIQKKLDNEREVFRSKIGGLKEQIQFKEQKVMEMHNQHVEGQEAVKKAEEEVKQLYFQNQQMRGQKLNLESQLAQLTIRLEALQVELQKKGKAFRSLEQMLTAKEQELKKYEHTINQKQTLLDTDGQHHEVQSQHLRGLIAGYRIERERKVSYVHPMLYEDARQQINNLTQAKQLLIRQCREKDCQIQRCFSQFEMCKLLKLQADRQMQEARRSILLHEEKLSVLKENQRILQNKLQLSQSHEAGNKQTQQLIFNLQTQTKQLHQQIQQLQRDAIQKNIILNQQENLLLNLKQDNEQLQQTIMQMHLELIQSQHQTTNLQQKNLILEKQQIQSQIKSNSLTQSPANKSQIAQKETQTEKKFNHSFKFEIAQHSISQAVQANSEDITLETREERVNPVRDREIKKVEANQFKRALKITYMRR